MAADRTISDSPWSNNYTVTTIQGDAHMSNMVRTAHECKCLRAAVAVAPAAAGHVCRVLMMVGPSACQSCRVQGSFSNAKGDVVYDLNDFDEGCAQAAVWLEFEN